MRCVGNKFLKTKSLLTTPSKVLPLYLKKTFPPIIRIFTEGEGDGIESRLSSKIFFTLLVPLHPLISRPSYGSEKYYKKGLYFNDVASLGRESTYITLKHTTKALEKRYTLIKACLIDI